MMENEGAASAEISESNAVNANQVADTVERTENVNDAPIDADAGKPSLKERLNKAAEENDKKHGREAAEKNNEPDRHEKQTGEKELEPAGEVSKQEEPPKFQPNWKYKAFGKEKELEEFWRPLVKDAESEKKVKEIFTRADAFDDMKQRYEASSSNGQQTLQRFTELERDVKQVTGFLNRGDLDNFFGKVGLSDERILNYLQQKANISRMGPEQERAYNESVQARAQNVYQQEQYSEMNQMMAAQKTELRRMQLDQAMFRPEVSSVASAFDSKMGQGQFRQLVIDEAIKAHAQAGQDLSGDEAVQSVLQRFGKLFEQATPQQSQFQAQQPQQAMAHQSAPQAPQVVNVQGKPVIPNVQGRGTSPVKQAPKSLSDLRKMGEAERNANAQAYQSQF